MANPDLQPASTNAPLLDRLFVSSDAPAFVFNGETWSRARLSSEAMRLASGFVRAGVKAGDRVALNLKNGPEMVMAYLACFRIGAVAAPMRQGLRTRELEAVLRRVGPELFLGHADLYEPVASLSSDVLPGDARFLVGDVQDRAARPWTTLLDGVAAPIDRHVDPHAPAALMATSGTTGEPKLVAQSHASLAAMARQMAFSGIWPGKVIAHLAPMAHMGGLAFAVCSLHNGAPFVILDPTDPDGILGAVATHRITWLASIPVLSSRLVEAQGRQPRDVSSLEVCFSFADVTPPATQAAFQRLFGHPLRSVWGSTEVVGPFAWCDEPGAISRPLPNVEIRLVDEDSGDVPLGEPGECVVRGACVAEGYWTGPGAVDAFPNGWYHTGDTMQQDAAGNFRFVARTKDLLKRNGQWVAPSEVEGVLTAHPAVEDAGIAGLPDGDHGQKVVGFVQLAEQTGPETLDEVLKAAATQLADHKVPERLVAVEAIPRNALGKIDRTQLGELEGVERDCRKVGGQAAMAIGGCGSLAAWKRCPKPAPSVPL